MTGRSVGLLLSVALLVGCGADSDWEGVVYPERTDLTEFESIGTFSSLDECEAAAIEELRQLGALDSGDWECGRN